ncbi:hypothetical protein [Pantoea agglomerans]|uniref:hypothetical protein n=1 Tax=Enterobacter agglomerans TaxID=549 RepID=UPI001F450D22|nr:hypothetical protein [Pantoea agglomerans]
MFFLYQVQDAGRRLYPRDFQFIQTPRAAFSNARIYYEMDYRCYVRQDISSDLPHRKTGNNDRFNPSDQYSGNNGYDPLYDATERGLNSGGIIGIDTSERWDPFYHPFYFDAESNLVFGGSRELRASSFEQAVRRAYEICLKRHHGIKPAPTLKKHYVGGPDQQASQGKTINSKAAGRLLAAGGVYNGNVEGFRKTAEQLGGDAVKGYDQVLNETTKGAAIAVASITAGLGKTRLNSLTRIDPRGLAGGQIGRDNNPLSSSRAARRSAMRQKGIPTSQQPVSQSKNSSGWEYRYEVSKSGGRTTPATVQQQTMDVSHPEQPHWEAGNVKIDPRTGDIRMNDYGRPKIANPKSKAYYKKHGG